ncbi:MAG: OB-fold nucleic acid binding domain-containing protein [Candidatus Bathyarchaeota archaeon]|nr:OB-fold nucleic acid binding domain-containing protein [Candidatus Bathyarchaeota archaeon]MDH5787873.1 OB-fold nucleic acid binding domain-containing protein [Candidatus Bathyarchaeota archaeon]
MECEKLIKQILSSRPEISREEILEKLEEEKRKTGGLISDETLLRMVAEGFGVEIPQNEALTPIHPLGKLVPSLSNVTVVGRVVAVFSPKTFKGINRNGKFASLFIADKSVIIRVVLWNDKTSLIESGEMKTGQIVRFSHGYTREDRSGKIELHIGEKSEVTINPNDVSTEDYPTIDKFATKIEKITRTLRNKRVNVIGTVKELFSVSTFKRKDSSSGKVMRFILADETGEMPVVVWNERVDELEKRLKKGVRLRVVNANVKKALGEGFEIHVNAGTFIETVAPTEKFLKIADLKEGLNRVNVEGRVVIKPMVRDVKTSKGEMVKLTVFELKDETGRIWVSAWRQHADIAKDLQIGNGIMIKNAYVKRGFGDQIELSTKNNTVIISTDKVK